MVFGTSLLVKGPTHIIPVHPHFSPHFNPHPNIRLNTPSNPFHVNTPNHWHGDAHVNANTHGWNTHESMNYNNGHVHAGIDHTHSTTQWGHHDGTDTAGASIGVDFWV